MGTAGLRRVEQIMGTPISVQLTDPLPPRRLAALAEQTFDWFREVDERFSTYKENSEVNRFHRGELAIGDCSADLRLVVEACADLWRETDGYFDAYATGRFDPSGYVKGWSVQVASDRLLAAGCRSHWINAGGDIRARGGPRPGEPWRIGIRHPWQDDRICWTLGGNDFAIATSGTYERGFHVIDPYRGAPATALTSVTVVGTDLGRTDAYATAGVAMGQSGLRWLAELPEHEVGIITSDELCYRTDGFPVLPLDPASGPPAPTHSGITDQPAPRLN
ncbi:FAD:protein FMN transferase [Plantactinospora sp. WMMC1484]|uniref:FAD:protein FMN transferase n=1 Tax=Plantactinospora sp. WMMC1484 TaxID=3404122 RepID=UPI003BF4DDF4